jgi:aminocarboxymuconate-semialdehyde decarboxylase
MKPTDNTPVIDVHAHLLIPSLQAAVQSRDPEGFEAATALDRRRAGTESGDVSGAMVRDRFALLTQLDARLDAMDRQRVDIQLVSPSPSHYYPWADSHLAMWAATTANAEVEALVASAPDRLRGLGLIPLQHPHLAVAALEDAIVHRGLAGVEISSGAGDVELSDPRLEPLWARAEELHAVIFLHPFGCTLDERLDRFFLSNTVGQPVENAVALSHLIFGGVLDRYPRLKIIAAHGGGYLPTSIGRADHAWAVRPDAHGCVHPPSSYLRRLWFDSLVHTPEALRSLVAAVGADRVVLGSDYPFDMGVEDPVERVLRAQLPATDVQQILTSTASSVLGLPARVAGAAR